jgi:hypothetical protein
VERAKIYLSFPKVEAEIQPRLALQALSVRDGNASAPEAWSDLPMYSFKTPIRCTFAAPENNGLLFR